MEGKSPSWVNRIYEKLTAPRTIIYCGYTVMVAYLGLLITAIILAATLGPSGFSFTGTWISNLGNIDTTPAPYLYDIACIAAGTLSLPFIFYQEKFIAPIPRTSEELPAPHRWTFRLMSLAFFFTLMANICYPGVGIFSEMRNYYDLHMTFTDLTFGAYMIGAFFFGLVLLITRQSIVPRPYNYIIGPIGMTAPSGMIILSMIEGNPLREWGTLWAILAFVIPVFLFTIHHARKQLH
jgi:hypothetical protein